jgi:hypothetical protein
MCIALANLSYEQSDLNPIEKHILLILCLRANPKTKLFWCSIKRIKEDSGYSLNTIDKTMKSLRDKRKILATGVKKGKLKVTPEYKVIISSNPTRRGDQNLVTPRENEDTPPDGVIGNPTTWDIERDLERSIKKERFLNSSGPQILKNIYADLGIKK